MASNRDPTAPLPTDPSERKRLENVYPPDWRNPKPREVYDLLVVGGGPGGLAAAHAAVATGASVALVEREHLGGDCLNVGCVPSKALMRTSRLYADMRNAEHFGARMPPDIDVDFGALMQRMRALRERISRADSIQLLASEGIDVYLGEGRFSGKTSLAVGRDTLRFRKAVIATGSRPSAPATPGLSADHYLTNETVFDLTALPARLVVIGGGPLGCELAQAFCRFGAKTTIVQNWPLFLPKEERDAAQILSEAFARDGLEVRLNTTATAVRVVDGHSVVELVSDDYKSTIAADAILAGAGRTPNVDQLNLEAGGVAYDREAGIRIDDFMRTSNPLVYAAGDVCLEHQYTHTAQASAKIAVQNALGSSRKRFSKLTIPWCTYTDPEIAHVGLYVREARERDIPVKTFTIPMHDSDRAILDGEATGFVKIHVKERSDEILGATIVARHAGEIINEITLAMVAGIGLASLADVIHAYPTQASAVRNAAMACAKSLTSGRKRKSPRPVAPRGKTKRKPS